MQQALTPTADPTWLIDETSYDPLRESSRESRFSISNGFLGVRGARAINRGVGVEPAPRTFIAGLFDAPGPEQPIPGLVTGPDMFEIRLLVHGTALAHDATHPSAHRRTLDMRRGVLLTDCHLSNAGGAGYAAGLHVQGLELVSLKERALALQLLQIENEGAETEITIEAAFAGMDSGLVSAQRDQHLAVWRTMSSGRRLAMAASVSLRVGGREVSPILVAPFRWSWTWMSSRGQIAQFDRIVAVKRSDRGGEDPGVAANAALEAALVGGWRGILAEHEFAWADRWRRSDIRIGGDASAQVAARFAIYHLNSAANPADDRVSIGARALTGDDYRGHVFWDTEIFLLPFYTLTWPEAARALLMYRFHTIDGAREKAARLGWHGALYAWESADTGADVTPRQVIGPDRKVVDVHCGDHEQHISADIAYAVWQYWQASGDERFLLEAGAEIVLETARFWSSRAQPEADGLCHIRDVIGPDEYHEHVDDNAFTNVMARWNIRRGLDVTALLRARWPERWAELSGRLGLGDQELHNWQVVADTMATGFDARTGLFEQFAGFSALDDVDLAAYVGRSVPMDVVLGRGRTQQCKIVKQADVVALLALLPDEFPDTVASVNFATYNPLCGHGSSLSRAMHGVAAARLGLSDLALTYFRQTAAIDLSDSQVAIDGGIHVAALGGVWLMAAFGFAGLSLCDDGIGLAPRLPAGWASLEFSIEWHGRRLSIRIDQAGHVVDVSVDGGPMMKLTVNGDAHPLGPGHPVRAGLRP